jgi:hypothetical protein
MIGGLRAPALKRTALAALLGFTVAMGRAQQPVTVELHHRSAQTLITALRPLVAPAALSGAGTRLQVRAAPADLPRVVGLIEQADRPLQPLLVSLRDDPPPAVEPDAPARDRSVTLSTGRPLAADSHGNGQNLSTRATTQPAPVLEGEALLLSMPASQSLWFGVRGGKAPTGGQARGGASTGGPDVAGVVPFDALSDFTARIWLAGETVAVDLEPRVAGRVAAGSEAGADLATVYGRIGQWIALADSGAQLAGAAAAPSGAPRAGCWIKVELARTAPGRQ